MSDETETIRRQRVAEINAAPGSREALEAQYGQVWDTNELCEEFEAVGFMAPLVVVHRVSRSQEESTVTLAHANRAVALEGLDSLGLSNPQLSYL